MPEAQAAVRAAVEIRPADARVERARPEVARFAALSLQLVFLLAVLKLFGLETPKFFTLACIVFAGFTVSYWLPLRFKEPFTIGLSLAGAFILLNPAVAALLIATGLAIFGVVRTRLQFRSKILVLTAILACLIYGRATGRFPVPREFWPVFGALFMFRTIVYLYDVKHMRGPARLNDFLSYFFLLPNYYFLLFPVVDFQTFRKSYFKRNIHDVAQQGVWWILRGVTHLLLYRLIYQLQGDFAPGKQPVPVVVAVKIVSCYLLYLRISGQFHIIAGMLCLFGYDMPETNRKYLLATSISDFWRRINIYWKDFMVKVFYFPAYFKMRRAGELRAQLLATALVFVATWFLHAYQFFWLQGRFRITLIDSLYWLFLGSLVTANVWIAAKRPKRKLAPGSESRIGTVLRTAATFTFTAILWSMWSANSLTEWFAFLRTGSI